MSTIGPVISERVVWDDIPSPGQGQFRKKYTLQHKYRSKPRDHTSPLPYYRRIAESSPSFGPLPTLSPADCLNFGANSWIDYKSARARAVALQAAYGKLVGKLKEAQQGWGENLATRKQALEMMIHRLGTLTLAARRLKKGDIPGFCRALGVTPRREKSKLRKASSIWLEYHFGWEPLYGDIYTACKMLSDDVPGGTIRGVGVYEVSDHSYNGYYKKFTKGRVIAVLQGDYYVENPNRFLLNQCGIINPIAVAWELVPFSFAVDWFIPIGQYLGGLTDFFGVGRRNEFTTMYINVNSGESIPVEQTGLTTSHAVLDSRTLGISVPKPTFKVFRGFSVTRGATALALCVGALRSLG